MLCRAPVRLQHKQEGQPGVTKRWRIEPSWCQFANLLAADIRLVAFSFRQIVRWTLYVFGPQLWSPRNLVLRSSLRKGNRASQQSSPNREGEKIPGID